MRFVPPSHHLKLIVARVILVAVAACLLVGCGNRKPKAQQPAVTSRYPTLPPKKLPAYLQGTILERVYVRETQGRPVSGFGLVANLNGTGDARTSNAVREYMIKTMEKRGFGSRQLGYEKLTPERVLRDPNFAIVRVDGLIPPGARPQQRFDIRVSALPNNNTTSLAHGQLYRTDLKIDGANPRAPGIAIDLQAYAEGELFVNPAYALILNPQDGAAKASLREGVVMGGGVVQVERPLALQLVQPSLRTARQIDYRLDEFLQDDAIARAQNEGVVLVTVPERYNGDWEHFVGVITHVYFNTSPTFVTAKAKQLAQEAVKPDAPLLDISYCWEALGQSALAFITPLMMHEKPDVAFAAARAAAFIGEPSSHAVLIDMARTQDHPFQISAVQVLAQLPASPQISGMLRSLLSSPHTMVRLEAYRALARSNDAAIYSRGIEQKFMLDIVPSDGPPLLYASRRGWPPRLAVFGRKPTLDLPITFTAMDGKLSISSTPGRKTVTIFYRGPGVRNPVKIESNPDIAEIAARLAGAGPIEDPSLPLTYCDVVAIVQALADQHKIIAAPSASAAVEAKPVAFVLQELPAASEQILEAPAIPGQEERRQSASPGTVSAAGVVEESPNMEIRSPKQ